MSQFAELFKAVKNEPKNSPDKNENDREVAKKKLKQVKVKGEKGGGNKSTDELNSDTENPQKNPQVSEKPTVVSIADEREPQLRKNAQIVGGQKTIGKSSNADYTQVLTYIRRDTHRRIKKVLIDDTKERDLSDLVEELLAGWLEKNS